MVLVTKNVAPERILEAYACGVRDFGENRVQEFTAKKKGLPADIRWHMIGHLQTNKVKAVLGQVELIHSLDRTELVSELERVANLRKIGEIRCLIQVNSSGEASKFGLAPGEVPAFAAGIKKDSPVKIEGLMTIGPLSDDPESSRRAFGLMRELRERLRKELPDRRWDILSMGMSGDYEMAVREGSTLVRIGTAVFGERPKPR